MKLAVAFSPKLRKFAAVPLQGPVVETLKLASEIGYEGVELNMGSPQEADRAELKEALKRNGLTAISIATGAAFFEEGLCLSAEARSDREAAVERIREQCAFGADIGAMVVIGIMRGRLDPKPEIARAQRERFIESLDRCAAAARDTGATLMIEPINRYETNFVSTTAEALQLLAEAGQSDVLLMLDTFHMNIEERSISAAIVQAKDRIGLVQTVDSNRRAPGLGHVDFANIVEVLRACGYGGFLSAEVVQFPDGESAARLAHSHLKAIVGTAS